MGERPAILLCLLVVTVLLYEPVRRHGFVNLDDPMYVSENQHVLGGLSVETTGWAFQSRLGGNWNPLVWLSLMADAEFFGASPAGYHVTNVLLHAANTLLLFLVLQRMTGAVWRSAFVAALFAWHPLHVESVAWVSGRKDLLCTFFILLTLMAYIRYVRRPQPMRYLIVVSCFVLALMSKAMAIT